METILAVENLAVRFGDAEVIGHVSFSLPKASSLAIIGPNGAGKTVLFKALIGALPSQGSIRWAPGARLGYVPQKLDIERDLPITGRDFLRAKAAVSKAPAEDILRVLARVSLKPPILDKLIGTMSGGQFQRLLVAFALLGNPNVLLLDEPTAGVDEPGQETLNEMMHRLQEEGVTILLISHDLTVVYRYATNVLCLSKEHSCFGAPREILTPETLQTIYGTQVGFYVHDAH
jgi:zinc transport system ATP-binding protein